MELLTQTHAGDLKHVRTLVNRGMDINFVDAAGVSALIIACEKGFLDIAVLLIEKGAKVKLRTVRAGNNCLHFAAQMCHDNVVELLLSRESSLAMIRNSSGDTALMMACASNVSIGLIETIKLIVEKVPECVNLSNSHGFSALHLLVKSASLSLLSSVKLLLDNGAAVNTSTIDGETPLHSAVYNGDLKMATILVSAGASVTAVTKSGDTVLHFAVRGCNKCDCSDVIHFLIDSGADLAYRNDKNQTPLDMVKLLTEQQCKKSTKARTRQKYEISEADENNETIATNEGNTTSIHKAYLVLSSYWATLVKESEERQNALLLESEVPQKNMKKRNEKKSRLKKLKDRNFDEKSPRKSSNISPKFEKNMKTSTNSLKKNGQRQKNNEYLLPKFQADSTSIEQNSLTLEKDFAKKSIKSPKLDAYFEKIEKYAKKNESPSTNFEEELDLHEFMYENGDVMCETERFAKNFDIFSISKIEVDPEKSYIKSLKNVGKNEPLSSNSNKGWMPFSQSTLTDQHLLENEVGTSTSPTKEDRCNPNGVACIRIDIGSNLINDIHNEMIQRFCSTAPNGQCDWNGITDARMESSIPEIYPDDSKLLSTYKSYMKMMERMAELNATATALAVEPQHLMCSSEELMTLSMGQLDVLGDILLASFRHVENAKVGLARAQEREAKYT